MGQRRDTYHHGDLRRTLVDAALEIVSEQGLGELTLRALGRKIGVSRTALYRHFSSKLDLLCAIAEQGFADLNARYTRTRALCREDGREVLRAMASAYLDFALRNPAQYRIMFGHILTDAQRTDALEAAARRAFGQLLDVLEHCQKQGLVRPGSPLAFANTCWSMVHGLASLLIDGQLQAIDARHGMPTLTTAGLKEPPVDVQNAVTAAIEVLASGILDPSSHSG